MLAVFDIEPLAWLTLGMTFALVLLAASIVVMVWLAMTLSVIGHN